MIFSDLVQSISRPRTCIHREMSPQISVPKATYAVLQFLSIQDISRYIPGNTYPPFIFSKNNSCFREKLELLFHFFT
jgi:hypothetical protein